VRRVAVSTLADILEGAAAPVAGLLTLIPGVGTAIGPIVLQALGLAADLVRRGIDAEVEIRRIRTSYEQRTDADTEEEWDAAVRNKFPVVDRSEAPTIPPLPLPDIYDMDLDD
jgi:hypothetical protein